MIPTRRIALWMVAVVLLSLPAAKAEDSLGALMPFLQKHCLACHGPDKQKNDRRFDTLGTDLSNRQVLEAWQDMLDQVNLGEMPPKKKPQPSPEERKKFVEDLAGSLEAAYARLRSTGAMTVIRRLNRIELRNTLRDLLYLDGAAFRPGAVAKLVDNNGNGRVERKGNDPVRSFPDDEKEAGFANIGNRLVMSDFLLKLMLGAAEEVLPTATHTEKKPAVETRRFSGHLITGKQYGQLTLETVSRELNPGFDMISMRYQRFGRLSPHELRGGVRTSARYRITVEASGHNQQHPWGELIKTDQDQPFLLSLNMADTANGGISGPTSTNLALWPLPGDGKKRTFSFETWMDDSWTPWLGWENGFYDRGFRAERLVEKYLPKAYRPQPDRKKVDKKVFDAWPIEMAKALLEDGYKGPHIRIYSLAVEPLIDTWPPRSHTALYGTGPAEKADVEKLLLNFASRAFRKPVKPPEVAPYAALVRSLMVENKKSSPAAIRELRYKAYKGKWSKLPQFSELEPFSEGVLTDGLLDIRPAKMRDFYGMVFEGNLHAPRKGKYRFEIASDDGSRLIIDGKRVIEHDGLHGNSTRKGSIELAAGPHALRVEYFAYGQPNSLRASWSGPGFNGAQLSVGTKAPKQLSTSNTGEARAIRALQAGYTAILCSPRFLYIQEKGPKLDNYELASRLSYFLWSSMPDERLLELARTGRLTNPKVRQQEVERLLEDPRAEAFTRNFTVAWLRLDKLGKMPPEKSGPFRFYHDRKMEPMLVSQTTTYFADMVKRNEKIRFFIDSDYTYMNETISNWIYNRKDVHGERLRKVALNDPRRGGIFTHPSVMTATANGVDTSPVVRGVYVLENILGTPPSPPPPDVEPLAPDLRGAKTIRQQLEVHRKSEACSGCHNKIDPLGFAMENFDPVGRWRDIYPARTHQPRIKIDPSSTLVNGQKLEDIVTFKKMLLGREHDVSRCLAEKLLTYASGRTLEPIDRGEVERIIKELKARKGGLRDLIKLVVESSIFLSK